MSGAVMLLMAVSIGITYGWTPDGGNGVKYIIQIPPEKVDQVVRTGEISSQIPAEIRSHVSEVVIRIGQGSVPRITPNFLSRSTPARAPDTAGQAETSAYAAADRTPVPIPAMGDPSVPRPIPGYGSVSTAVMKPSPQGGGMNLPGGFGMTPATGTNAAGPSTNFGQVARDTANNMATQFQGAVQGAIDNSRTQVEQTFNTAADRLGENASAQMQATTNNLRDSASQLFNTNTRTGSSDPDDPRARLSQNNYAANGSTNRPSTDTYNRNTDTRSGYPSTSSNETAATPPPFATSRAGMPSTSPTSTASRSGKTSTSSDDWYDPRNGSRRRPSTDPVDSTNDPISGGGLAGGNFGRLPAGLQPDTTPRSTRSSDTSARTQYTNATYADTTQRTSSTTSNVDYDPNLTPAQAAQLPKNGYSFDAENYPVDRQGYRLDQYGRRVDRQGRLLTAVDTMGGQNAGTSNSNNQSAPNNYGQPRNPTNTGLYANDPNRSTNIATAGPPNLNSASNQGNNYPTNTNFQNNSPQLVQPPLAPNNGNYAGGNYPNTASQYANTQYPTSQYPTSPYPGTSQYGSNNPQSGLSPTLSPGMPGYPQYPDPRLASLTGNTSNSGGPNMPSSGNGSSVDEDSRPSPSDRDSRSDRFATSSSALANGPSDSAYTPEQVAAQPIFNALLLLSIVANVYLLFWLKNLRLQFRDMVATKRANKASNSLAASV